MSKLQLVCECIPVAVIVGAFIGTWFAVRDDFTDRLPDGETYTIAKDRQSITCHLCGRKSYHPKDIEEKYCGWCHRFHEDPNS